jgi:hypothetical protein
MAGMFHNSKFNVTGEGNGGKEGATTFGNAAPERDFRLSPSNWDVRTGRSGDITAGIHNA